MRYIKYVETKLGKIGIVEKDNKIVKVIIINGSKENSKRNKNDYDNYQEKDTELLLKAKKELEEYFEGKRKEFDLPLEQEGTEFQKKTYTPQLLPCSIQPSSPLFQRQNDFPHQVLCRKNSHCCRQKLTRTHRNRI